MYLEKPLQDYIHDAMSNMPAPGGGSVSALAGALGATMSLMAANFTAGKKKFADVDQEVRGIIANLDGVKDRLLALMEQDIAAYQELSAAFKMPRETAKEKKDREKEIEATLKSAMDVPRSVMAETLQILESAERLAEIANPNLISDVGVSAILAAAATEASKLNVLINAYSIKDRELVDLVLRESDDALRKAEHLRHKILGKVHKTMKKE